MPDLAPYDLVVIGAGMAGVAAANKCAAAGWKVAIVDELPYGGTCAVRGCDPKKILRRGAEIIDARGASSAASAANAAIDHVRDWVLGTPDGDWVSMAVPADGSYGIGEGIICGQPCTCSGGEWSVVQGLEIPDFSRERIDASVIELQEERDAIAQLGLI